MRVCVSLSLCPRPHAYTIARTRINITRTRNVSEYMLVLALCLVITAFRFYVPKLKRPALRRSIGVDSLTEGQHLNVARTYLQRWVAE